MNEKLVQRIANELDEIKTNGLFKTERIIESAQGPEIMVNGKVVLNFCANNYLGLSSHPKVIEAAKKYIDLRGFGMSSVRFICGTQDIHRQLETRLARFLMSDGRIDGRRFIDKELLDAMPPYQGGGAMIDRVTFAKTTYASGPQRFEAGPQGPAFLLSRIIDTAK